MTRVLTFAFLSLFALTGCGSSYGSLGMPFSSPAAARQQAAPQTVEKTGDFTVAEAPPLAAIPNDPVQIAPIAGSENTVEPIEMPGPDACNPSQELIGQHKSVVNTMLFKHPVRVLGPDDAATMDYQPLRTNILYDKNGVIFEVRCG